MAQFVPWHRKSLPKGADVVSAARGKRLEGLDEFEQPEFVGRMSRIERRRKLAWYAMLVGATAIGGAIGLEIF